MQGNICGDVIDQAEAEAGMTRAPGDSPTARALRAAGYIPLPRWWMTQDQVDLIAYMARQNKPEIDRIKDTLGNDDQISEDGKN